MNNDSISRSTLKEIWELYEKYQPCLATNVYEFGVALKGIIENAPAVRNEYMRGYEAAEREYKRPQGEWIETQRGIHVTDYKCSCCGRTVRDNTGYDVASDYPFCHCGANMRGEDK